jgi:hypothetical protein
VELIHANGKSIMELIVTSNVDILNDSSSLNSILGSNPTIAPSIISNQKCSSNQEDKRYWQEIEVIKSNWKSFKGIRIITSTIVPCWIFRSIVIESATYVG